MLFASVNKNIFWQKSYIMSSIKDENGFNKKLVFGLPLKGPLKRGILVYNKKCDKN